MLNSDKIQDILLFGQINHLSDKAYFSFAYRAKPIFPKHL